MIRSLISIKHRLQHHPTFLLILGVKNNVAFVRSPHSTLHARMAITVTLWLSVSMVLIYSLHLLRALLRLFKLQICERAKFWMSERRKLERSLFECEPKDNLKGLDRFCASVWLTQHGDTRKGYVYTNVGRVAIIF